MKSSSVLMIYDEDANVPMLSTMVTNAFLDPKIRTKIPEEKGNVEYHCFPSGLCFLMWRNSKGLVFDFRKGKIEKWLSM